MVYKKSYFKYTTSVQEQTFVTICKPNQNGFLNCSTSYQTWAFKQVHVYVKATVEEEDVDEEEEDCTKDISASCIYIIVICSLNLLFLFLFKTKEMKEVCVDKCKKKEVYSMAV